AGETWNFMAMTKKLGGETWFKLGDHDLAIHVERTRRLALGESLSAITSSLCARLGLRCAIYPMSNDRVRTMVDTDQGELAFQEYFVRRHCEPKVRKLRFEGVDTASIAPQFAAALTDAQLEAIVIAPSNPFLSVAPILALTGVEEHLRQRKVPAVAISPIVGGKAIKGPAAKILRELGNEVSALSVARHYQGLIDGFVLDDADAGLSEQVRLLGMRPLVTNTIMSDPEAATTLAQRVLQFTDTLRAETPR
ncbi:MAG: 2-phospho-L-lactate transferase CofD family protein, partial [Burkholderiales bacterium]